MRLVFEDGKHQVLLRSAAQRVAAQAGRHPPFCAWAPAVHQAAVHGVSTRWPTDACPSLHPSHLQVKWRTWSADADGLHCMQART